MKKIVFLFLVVPFLFFGCKKDDVGCDEPEPLYFHFDEDVQIGWPLKMYINESVAGVLVVTFPNGESKSLHPDDLIKNSYYILTDSATNEHSGTYKAKLSYNGCVGKFGTNEVEVLPILTPTCTVPDNTGTSTIGGIGDKTYAHVYKGPAASYYSISGEDGVNTHIRFSFQGNTPPKPGLYTTYPGSGFYPITDNPKEVAVALQSWVDIFYIKDYQNVYVNYENGNIEVTMCSAEFKNVVSTTPLFISTKLVISQ
jgi:hypothetical protein